jgi:hypothetical protein
MFNRIAPQRAQHSLGFIVQTGGRFAIQYLEKDFVVEVMTDLTDAIAPLYVDTLAINKAGTIPSGLSPERAKVILDRIKDGLDCLEIKYEICEGRPYNT